MAFKMKGSPMQRNFGIGSPMNKNGDDPGKKSTASTILETVKEGEKKVRKVLDPVGAAMGLGGKFIETASEALSKVPVYFGTKKREV